MATQYSQFSDSLLRRLAAGLGMSFGEMSQDFRQVERERARIAAHVALVVVPKPNAVRIEEVSSSER